MIRITADFSKILSLRLKICLGDSNAISEADEIAKGSGYSDCESMMKDIDKFLDKFSDEIGLTPYWITAYLVIMQAFKDFPEMGDHIAKSQILNNTDLFNEFFNADRFKAVITEIKPNKPKRNPLPRRPANSAPLSVWFKYYYEREKLGYKITLLEIAKATNYEYSWVRHEKMAYDIKLVKPN